jgi:hypothetical protein
MYISLHADYASSKPDTDETKSDDNEEDNAPIAASLLMAPMGKQVTKSKGPAMRKTKEKRQTWAYVPVVDGPSTYWECGVDGKRTRTLRTASYRDDDARSDLDDDPEDLFKPGKDYASSSEESVTEPSAKKKVSSPYSTTHRPPCIDLSSRIGHRYWMRKKSMRRMRKITKNQSQRKRYHPYLKPTPHCMKSVACLAHSC